MIMEDREKGFERKHAHDEEQNFKIAVRRAKLVGLWVAEKLGLQGEAADTYAKSVVVADLEEAGVEDLLRKVKADLLAKKIEVSETELHHLLHAKLMEATAQVKTDHVKNG